MIYLSDLTRREDGLFVVSSIHYMPFDKNNGLNKTEEELLKNGYLVNSLPDIPKEKELSRQTLIFNKETGEAFYEFEDVIRELTQEEKLQELQQKYDLMQSALDELIFGGML